MSQPAVPARTGGIFPALRESSYRTYWAGLIAYVVGWKFEEIIYYWLVWDLSRDPLMLGLLGATTGIPLVLFQLFGGVFADRVNRLRLLVSTQAVTGVLMLVAAGFTLPGAISVPMILAFAFVSATFRAFEQPTRMSLIPHIVSRDNLPNAIAIGSMPWQAGRIVGPSLGGVLLAVTSPGIALLAAGAAYLGAVGLYSRITVHGSVRGGASGSALRAMAEGIGYVNRHGVIRTLMLLSFFNSIFGLSYIALMPAFAGQSLGAGPEAFGFLQAAGGLGAIIGSTTLAAVANRITYRGVLMLAGAIGFGTLLAAFSLAPFLGIALVLIFCMGFANTFYLTTVQTIVQEEVPDTLRGRVMGIFGLVWNLIPLGGVFAGVMASAFGVREALFLAGSIVALTAVIMLVASPLRRLRRRPVVPATA